MAQQVGPQERKPDVWAAPKAREGDEDVLGEFHQGPQTIGLQLEAEYKRATRSSLCFTQISLAKPEAPL
jgi:hypothetical protein